MPTWDCIRDVGFISCVMSMISRSTIPPTKTCSLGAKRSRTSTIEPLPMLVLIRLYLLPNSRPPGGPNNMASSKNCGQCVLPLLTRLRLSIPCVNASNASYQNSSSLWRCLGCLLIIILLREASGHWSLPAKSAAALAVQRGPTLVWLFSVFSVRGLLKDLILSHNASPCSPSPLSPPFSPKDKSEQIPLSRRLDNAVP